MLWFLLTLLLLSPLPSWAQNPPHGTVISTTKGHIVYEGPLWGQAPTPAPVLLYEAHKRSLPHSNFNLNLCTLLSRAAESGGNGRKFYALPTDTQGPTDCDLRRVILAYGGWCRAGLEDATGPHFSQALLPMVQVVHYSDGRRVIYVNNYLKSFTEPTPADLEAARLFLRDPQAKPALLRDIRGGTLPLFPPGWETVLPLRKSH